LIWFDTSVPGQVILELRAEDRVGLLSRLAGVFATAGANVRWAKVVTMGSAVVDAFCLDLGDADSAQLRARIEKAVLDVVPRPAPTPPPGENAAD
jgi:[protein-PII] uridylyltransferase